MRISLRVDSHYLAQMSNTPLAARALKPGIVIVSESSTVSAIGIESVSTGRGPEVARWALVNPRLVAAFRNFFSFLVILTLVGESQARLCSEIFTFSAAIRAQQDSAALFLEVQFAKQVTPVAAEFHSLFAAETLGKLTFRSKSRASILNKLQRRDIRSYDKALQAIDDGLGARLILSDSTPTGVDTFLKVLETAIVQRKIKIQTLENYQGENVDAYLSDAQVERLVQTVASTGATLVTKTGVNAYKKSGYTTLQMNVETANGHRAEFQVRGAEIDRVAEAEHAIYDIKSGKSVDERSGSFAAALRHKLKTFNERQIKTFVAKLKEAYKRARICEQRGLQCLDLVEPF